MRVSGVLRLLVPISALVITWVFLHSAGNIHIQTIRLPRWLAPATTKELHAIKSKCGNRKPCTDNSFAFKISSGAANVVGPSICFEDKVLMSPVKNNVGRGLNIVLVNGTTGAVLRDSFFDMYSGDPSLLERFLKEVPEGTLVLVASYDDPGTKMNEQLKKLFSDLGSSSAKQLGFRDSWVFLGARGLKNKSPFEQFLKNNPEENKYDGWPELLELEGCVPRKVF